MAAYSFDAGGIEPENLSAMKRHPVAASGKCVVPVVKNEAEADAVLAEHQITVIDRDENGSIAKEKQNLARGVLQAKALYGGRFPPFINTQFEFSSRVGHSRQLGYSNGKYRISMNRCDSKGNNCAPNNVAHMMHELGHQVGNSKLKGGMTYYEAYDRAVGDCHTSRYSKTNDNEEFADAFAAFTTNPEHLLNGDGACKRAYAFFAEEVFPANGRLASCDPRARIELASRLDKTERIDSRLETAQAEIADDWLFGEAPQRMRSGKKRPKAQQTVWASSGAW